jgi:hypothetical protein
MEAAGAGAAGPVSYRFFSGLNGEYSGDGEQLPWSGARAACFGADGEALVQLPEPGTWTVSWRLSVHQPRDRSEPWSPCVPRTIEVRDVPGAQTTTLGLGAEQLQAARTRLLSAR